MKKYILAVTLVILGACAFAGSGDKGNSVSFRENKGQVSDQYFKPRPDILFSGSAGELNFHLKQNGISYQLSKAMSWQKTTNKTPVFGKGALTQEPAELNIYRLDINWLNCSKNTAIETGKSTEGVENYYTEVCPGGVTGVKNYRDVTYKNIYTGIDLKWYENDGQLEYDYLVAAGADYRQIVWEINGALSVTIDKNGNLIIKTPLGDILENAPVVLQDGKNLDASWVVSNNRVSFNIKNCDASKPFIIDPLVRLWGTYYGGSDVEYTGVSCVDKSDNVFLTGGTKSTANIATVGAYQTVYGGNGSGVLPGDAFVVKFNPQGVRQWATYYGGSGADFSSSCTADGSGNVYLVGHTTSTNAAVMVTSGCHQPVYGGAGPTNSGDVMIVKLNASGARVWATYYGGTSDEWGLGSAIDASDNLYLTGGCEGTGTVMVTAGAQQAAFGGGGYDAFLASFSPSGARLWGTYYGGSGVDQGVSCKLDVNGNVYLTGYTSSTLSPVIATSGCHQYTLSAALDAFLVKFDGSGNRQWGTYYGGNLDDYALTVDFDKFNNVYIAGATASSTNIATAGAYQSTYGGGKDAFLVKFNASGVRQFGTYYGGNGTEDFGCCSLDSYGNIYLGGTTSTASGTVIASQCAYQASYGGGASDDFLAKFDATGNRIWGTYYGGAAKESGGNNAIDYGPSVLVDGANNVYLVGIVGTGTGSLVIASPGSQQTSYGGGTSDAFLAKFDGCRGITVPSATMLTVCAGKTVSITTTPACATYWYTGPTGNNLLFPGSLTAGPFTSDTTFYAEDLLCGPGLARVPVTLTVIPSPTVSVSASNSTVCAGESLTLSAFGAVSYSWQSSSSTTSLAAVVPTVNTTYSVVGTGTNGCSTTATVSITANICAGIKGNNVGAVLSIYPNPNQGEFTINASQEITICIINGLGQSLSTYVLSSANHYRAKVADLPNGVYFIKGTGNSGDSALLQKIIVSK